MAVYCGQQTKYAKVNYGEPGTAQHLFYHLITIACVFVTPIVTPITFYRAAPHSATDFHAVVDETQTSQKDTCLRKMQMYQYTTEDIDQVPLELPYSPLGPL